MADIVFDDLLDKQQKFIDMYLDLGDRNEAYRKAGYSVEGRAWKANARAMFLKFEAIIEARVETRIGEGALLALTVIQELMEDPNCPPAVRLKCAQDYLKRGGRDRDPEVKVVHTKESAMSDKELDAEITALQGKVITYGSAKLQ